MSRFEQDGVDRQREAANIKEAQRAFAFSCTLCCIRGRHLDCKRCAIANKHQFVMECFAV